MEQPGIGEALSDVTFCNHGEIANFPVIFTSLFLKDYLTGIWNTYHIEGLYAPSGDTFRANTWDYSWETVYLTEDQMAVNVPGTTIWGDVGFSLRMRYAWEMKGEYEPITVPSGSYPQALKVYQTMRVPVTISGLPGFQGAGSLVLESIQWYEPYVGLVRAELTSAKIVLSGSFEYPLDAGTVIELVEFSPGQ
jgi:hypothetical protein